MKGEHFRTRAEILRQIASEAQCYRVDWAHAAQTTVQSWALVQTSGFNKRCDNYFII